jgi:hypothetical protein
VNGWLASRRLAGFVVAGAVVTTTVVAARQDPDASATAVEPVAMTAWLPAGTGETLVLADARHRRALTSASLLGSVTSIAQAGDIAVTVQSSRVTAQDNRQGRWEWDKPLPDPMFATGGPTGAWLVSSAADKALRVATADPGRLSDPVRVPRGLTPRDVRVDDDGTLWILGDGELRGVAPGMTDRVVPLESKPSERALTIVAGDPVVIAPTGARRLDRARLTFDAPWPLDLPGGPYTAAERSDHLAVVRTPSRLAVTGPGAIPAVMPVPHDPAPGQPVERDGLVYLTEQSAHQVHVYDPRLAPDRQPSRRISVPGRGRLTLTGHRGHVWFSQPGPSGSIGKDYDPGIITEALTARLFTRTSSLDDEGRSNGEEAEYGPADDQAEMDDERDESEWLEPILDLTDDWCPDMYTAARCPTDPRQPERGSGATPDANSVDCFDSWSPDDCTVTRFDRDNPGGPDGTKPPGPSPQPEGPPPPPDLPVKAGDRAEDAKLMLQGLGYRITTVEVPSLEDKGEVVGLFHPDGTPVLTMPPPPADLVIKVSDGTWPVADIDMNLMWISVACVVIDGNNRVACWGDNMNGSLGPALPVGVSSDKPVFIPDVAATQVTVNSYGACALLLNEQVSCWGNSDPVPRPINFPVPTRMKQIDDMCGLDIDGLLWCWDDFATAKSYPNVGRATSLDGHCVLLVSSRVRCWLMDPGQVEASWLIGTEENEGVPASPHVWDPVTGGDLENVTHITDFLGGGGCAVTEARGIFCWGPTFVSFEDWQPTRQIPGTGGATGPISIGSLSGRVCAAFPGFTLRCWGRLDKRLGNERVLFTDVPAPANIDSVQQVVVGDDTICVIKLDRSVWCWGRYLPPELGEDVITPARQWINPP